MSSTITAIGNLTRDPELRFTSGGKAVVSFGIAVSRRYKAGDDWKEDTSFFNVTAWDQLGENAAASLSKGARVIVTGRVETREYEARDGGKKLSVDITADEIGAAMRWATVQIERNERQSPTSARPGRSQPAPYQGDEEPF